MWSVGSAGGGADEECSRAGRGSVGAWERGSDIGRRPQRELSRENGFS
jgi:hypothetical protein